MTNHNRKVVKSLYGGFIVSLTKKEEFVKNAMYFKKI